MSRSFCYADCLYAECFYTECHGAATTFNQNGSLQSDTGQRQNTFLSLSRTRTQAKCHSAECCSDECRVTFHSTLCRVEKRLKCFLVEIRHFCLKLSYRPAIRCYNWLKCREWTVLYWCYLWNENCGLVKSVYSIDKEMHDQIVFYIRNGKRSKGQDSGETERERVRERVRALGGVGCSVSYQTDR